MFSLAQYKNPLASKYVGFEDFFGDIDKFLENSRNWMKAFPMYDVVRSTDGTSIQLAVAGYGKDDISVTFNKSNGLLTISGSKQKEVSGDKVFSSLAARNFTRSFTLHNTVEVESAKVQDGMLTVKLKTVKELPEVVQTVKVE